MAAPNSSIQHLFLRWRLHPQQPAFLGHISRNKGPYLSFFTEKSENTFAQQIIKSTKTKQY